MGESFLSAYVEYLERMLLSSDNLVTVVAEETVPEWALPQTQEWAWVA